MACHNLTTGLCAGRVCPSTDYSPPSLHHSLFHLFFSVLFSPSPPPSRLASTCILCICFVVSCFTYAQATPTGQGNTTNTTGGILSTNDASALTSLCLSLTIVCPPPSPPLPLSFYSFIFSVVFFWVCESALSCPS